MNKILSRIGLHIKTEANYLFFRRYRYWRVAFRHLSRYYTPDAAPSVTKERMIVFMADGRYLHGGFADRLRSILTNYRYCRDHGIRFAINFTFPFPLENYLESAAYDWRLKPGELTFNSREAMPVFTDTAPYETVREMTFRRNTAYRAFAHDKRQIHLYGALYWDDSDFATLFRQLFRPVPHLQAEIDRHIHAIGGKYVSVSTRFMELLGDFTEPKPGTVLSPEHRQSLIDRCISQLESIHGRHPEAARILVTSDSSGFLEHCSALPYVYVIPGAIAHSDTASATDHTKTFVDFMMISHASKAYQLIGGGMYGGNFSLRASQIAGVPYERITF